MTYKEYKIIERIIDEEIESNWVSINYQQKHITMGGVTRIKERIRELVEDDKNARNK